MDLSALAQKHVDRIWKAARAKAPDDHAAWDCVQEAFATALAAGREPAGDPVAWLCGVARNHARHWKRGRDRWHRAIERSVEHRKRQAVDVDQAALHDALAEIPLEQRDAVVLRYLTGRTFREVAEAQGISEPAAKSRVRRGLMALRGRLGAAPLALLLLREAEAGTALQVATAATAGVIVKKHITVGIVLVALLGAGTALIAWRRNAPEPERAVRPPADHAMATDAETERPETPPPAAQGFLVRVVDASTRAAIAGARVTGARWEGAPPFRTATTGALGRAVVAPFCGSLSVRATGYITSRRTVIARTGGLLVALQPGIPVTGRVVWKGTRRGVEAAAVRLTDAESADHLDTVSTDATGRFELAGVRPDLPYVVEATRFDLAPAARMLWPADGEALIELGGGGVLAGRVLGPDGKPSPRATVDVRPVGRSDKLLPNYVATYNAEYETSVTTDHEGRFRLEGLRAPASYELRATDDERSDATAEPAAFARDGDTVWRELRLKRRTSVVIEVVAPETEPLPQPSFSLWRDGKVVGMQGNVYTHFLEKGGDYEVLALAKNWPRIRVPVRVVEGRKNVVRIPMSRDGRVNLSGRTLDHDDAPIQDITVQFSAGGRVHRTTTGPDGWFYLHDLPDAEGRLSAEDPRAIRGGWSRDNVRAGDGPFVIPMQARARFVGRLAPVPARVVLHRRYPHHRFKQDEEISTRPLSFDENGRFEIPWSPGRRIRLTFEPAHGAAIRFDESALRDGEVRDLGVLRIDPGPTAEGLVLDDEGAPVARARIVVEIEGVFRDRVAYTNREGRFRFAGLPHTPLGVTVTAAGFRPHRQDLATGEELHLQTIRLHANGTLAGRLTKGGAPLPGAELELTPARGGESFRVTSDSVGRFRGQLPPGRYRLVVGEGPGVEVEIRAKHTTRVDVELD